MPYKKKKSVRKIPHEIIEKKYKFGRKREYAFGKDMKPFSVLKKNTATSSKSSVCVKSTDYDYLLHTHVIPKNGKLLPMYTIPSNTDLFNSFLTGLFKNNTNKLSRNVVSIMKGKKEIGRVHFKATQEVFKNFKGHLSSENAIKPITMLSFLTMKSFLDRKTILTQENITLLENNFFLMVLNHPSNKKFKKSVLKKNKTNFESPKNYSDLIDAFKQVGFQFRFVGLPGYTFNKNKMIFEKKSN